MFGLYALYKSESPPPVPQKHVSDIARWRVCCQTNNIHSAFRQIRRTSGGWINNKGGCGFEGIKHFGFFLIGHIGFPAPRLGCGISSVTPGLTIQRAQSHLFRLVLFPPKRTSCQTQNTPFLDTTHANNSPAMYFRYLLQLSASSAGS